MLKTLSELLKVNDFVFLSILNVEVNGKNLAVNIVSFNYSL
jgi:hypothetical protein